MSARRLPALALPLALLVACGGTDAAAERRDVVSAITAAANGRDADEVRRSAERLAQLVEQQRADEELPPEEAERLAALAAAVLESADLVDEELQKRLRAEAEAAQARKELEEAQRRLEEERRRAEEAARKGEEERKDEGKGEDDKGKGDEGKDD